MGRYAVCGVGETGSAYVRKSLLTDRGEFKRDRDVRYRARWCPSSPISLGCSRKWPNIKPAKQIESAGNEHHMTWRGHASTRNSLKLNMTRGKAEQLLGKPSGRFRETFSYLHEHTGTIRCASYTWENSIDIGTTNRGSGRHAKVFTGHMQQDSSGHRFFPTPV